MACPNNSPLRFTIVTFLCLLFAAGCGRTSLGFRSRTGNADARVRSGEADSGGSKSGDAPDSGLSPADARRDLSPAPVDVSPDRRAADLPKTGADAANDKIVDAPLKDGTDAVDTGRLDAARDRPGEIAADATPGTLALVAGATGGRGSSDGIGRAARFSSQEGLAADGKGNLYVADSGNHTIRKIVLATAEVTTIAGTPGISGLSDGIGSQARFYLPTTLTCDGAGNLFVVDQNARAIRKIALDTGRVDTLVAFTYADLFVDGGATWGPVRQMRGIASDGHGNLFVADYDGSTVRKIVVATGEISVLAGSPDQRELTDGTGPGARFFSPSGLAIDKKGNLFVADNWYLRKVILASGQVSTVAKAANVVAGVATDDSGVVFIADVGSHAVRRLDPGTGELSTLFTQTADPDIDGQDASRVALSMNSLADDGAGNLYISEQYEHRIRRIEIATGRASPLAGDMQRLGTADGIGGGARFAEVNGLVFDDAGNLFVADGAGTIRKIDPTTREVSTFAGIPSVRGSKDGVGKAATFLAPYGLTNDGLGNLFVTDENNGLVRKLSLSSAAVTTLAGTGSAAGFSQPAGVASDGAGNLFVVDRRDHTIRKIVTSTGEVTTFAGKSGTSGSNDGASVDARFMSPQDVISDGAGSLFVSDGGNATIRKIVLKTGQVSTLAGTAESTGYADGVGAAARFNLPKGLAYDKAGFLYVADSENHLVRRIVVATAAVSTVIGNPGRAGVVLGSLPGGLSSPEALALGPTGELIISSLNELVVLVARFH